ncbi:hypothetical protein [Mycobacterium sp. NAZ190054]|uniref:hypothetical protein n=1 Tax=Mycobacterium sp. NAZ190054 TaxID=1747766 RepID=UPI000791EA3C|nr:hypothetical protein [Mycobacterium sp. NAZ190054]KWX60312.1 hypothetical protein ASJ79_01380 [Mycobacterium sp. NAZ190054]
METITAVAIVVALSAWHLHNRRHPGWLASSAGRCGVFSGYLLITIAAFWLVTAPTTTTWEWAFGNLWALAAMVAFVSGFDALNRATAEHAVRSQSFEAVDPSEATLPRP